MNSKNKLALHFGALLVSASIALATPIFSDDFSDNNRDGWLSSSTATSGNLDASSGALFVNSGRSIQTHFSSATLAVGESISLNFDVSFSNPTSQNGGFRLGLFDSNGSAIPTGDGNTAYSAYKGFIVTTNPAATTGTPVVFRTRTVDGDPALLTTLTTYTAVGNTGSANPVSVSANTFVNVNLMLSRTETGLSLSFSIMQGETTLQTHSVVTTSPSTYTFDALGISAVTALNAFTIDNVVVDYSAIPEPSAYAALAGAGVLGLAFMRRRRA